MAIVKMKHLQVLALERDHDAILRRLQHMGCLEISEPDVQALPDTLHRCDTAAADLLARQRQLQSAIDILRRTAPPQKTGLLTPASPASPSGNIWMKRRWHQSWKRPSTSMNCGGRKPPHRQGDPAPQRAGRPDTLAEPGYPAGADRDAMVRHHHRHAAPLRRMGGDTGHAEPTGAGIGGIPAVRRFRAAAGHPAADPQGRDGSGTGAAAQLRFLRRAAQGPPWYAGGKPDGRWRTVCVRPPRKRTPPCRSWPA